MSTIYYQRPDL